ncbi:Na+/H+ antiporter subunit C [Thioalkalivibrio denitrificans]|uniref:Na+/H+ antiporter subunit C n=1 Tax=Thioalkalivibrio denitrificans TaxID=108003 RepID=A0A1V3NIM1_9GAMM|nr:Na+/H+ antiporter subunit C [Thioalkalivibrio denitrificans]
MTSLYLIGGAILFGLGVHALVARAHLVLKVLAVNVMGSGVFMVLLAAAAGGEGDPDPVPHALVLTGIVVAVSATAFALALILRVKAVTGRAHLPEGEGDAESGGS